VEQYSINVETFSFQALPFYKKSNYESFGVLDNYPSGCQRIFLKKRLA